MLGKFKSLDSRHDSIYAVYDCLTGHFVDFCIAVSDGLAARHFLTKLRYPLADTQLVKLLNCNYFLPEIKKDGQIIKADCPDKMKLDLDFKVLDWKCYKFPDTLAEALAPLDLSNEEIKEISENKIKQFAHQSEKE